MFPWPSVADGARLAVSRCQRTTRAAADGDVRDRLPPGSVTLSISPGLRRACRFRPRVVGSRGQYGPVPGSHYPPLPAFVRGCTQADIADQRIKWSWAKEPWPEAFRDHADLRAELEGEVRDHGGIRREFVFDHADGDPAELFLLAMAWGFGLTTVHWPSQRRMLTAEFPRSKLAEIIRRNARGRRWRGLERVQD